MHDKLFHTSKTDCMKKSLKEAASGNIPFCIKSLDDLHKKGYKYVLIKGFTIDKHFEYVDPSILVLVPVKELPSDPMLKEIYEPIQSEILYKWATERNEYPQILIAKKF